MNSVRMTASRGARVVGSVAITAAFALGATGCSAEGVEPPESVGESATTESLPTSDAEAALDAGLKAYAYGDLTTARERYKATLELDPTNKVAHFNLALINQRRGHNKPAARNLRAALSTDPHYEPALMSVALLRVRSAPD